MHMTILHMVIETDFWKPFQTFDHGHNIFEHNNILEKFRFTTGKVVVKIWCKKHCIRVATRVAKRLKILGN